jgi:hypothetical protein
VAFADRAPVPKVPLVGSVPLQAPEAVQVVAFVELQVSVAAPPVRTDCGLAIRLTVGTGITATVTEAGVLVPACPVQVRVYVVLIVRAAVV